MDRKKLAELRKAIEKARRSLQDASTLEDLAAMAGRVPRTNGKHPTWISSFSVNRPFPISRHGGNPKVGHRIQKQILDHLEADAAEWEELLDAQESEDEDE